MQIINGNSTYSSDRTSDEYICINSCGFYNAEDMDIKPYRKNGRSDYEFIYISKGKGHFIIDGEETVLTAGWLRIYRPSEPQIHTFYSKDLSEHCWIHFCGTGIPGILKKAGLADKKICYLGKNEEIKNYILKIIKEIRLKQPQYNMFCNSYFLNMVSVISRSINQTNNKKSIGKYKKIISVLELFHNNYSDNYPVQYYADICGLDKYYFISLFKEYTGMPPHMYITNIKIEKAKELLTDTELSNAEIAESIGYTDPFYFSRIFKKYTGVSPTSFKKSIRF